MSGDTWVLVLMALLIAWSFLDKIGDARTTEAEAKKAEADARLLEAENRAAELAGPSNV